MKDKEKMQHVEDIRDLIAETLFQGVQMPRDADGRFITPSPETPSFTFVYDSSKRKFVEKRV